MRKRCLKSIENTEKIVLYMCKESDEKRRVFHQIFSLFKEYFYSFGSISKFYQHGSFITKTIGDIYILALKEEFINKYGYTNSYSCLLERSIIDSIFFVFDTISIIK